MWIELKDKKYYLDSSLNGLRLRFYSGVDSDVKKECKDFCRWLRKKYWFPVRVNCNFFNYTYFLANSQNDKDSVADFYYSKNDNDKTIPTIWIATGEIKKRKPGERKTIIQCFQHNIAHELTHYFQWYFLQFDKRTDRSLEIEATKWSDYLLCEYLDENKR